MSDRLRTSELTPRIYLACFEEFTPRRRSKGLYCSRPCANAGVSRTSAAKRGEALRGRGAGRTYRKLLGRHEHRVVAEQTLGRPLVCGEVVHHIDGDKLNNAPENLAVMTQAQHMREHGLAIPGVRPAWEPWTERWSQ